MYFKIKQRNELFIKNNRGYKVSRILLINYNGILVIDSIGIYSIMFKIVIF